MKQSEIEGKLAELESRVKNLKDWKQKYEEDKGKWEKERGELLRGAEAAQKLKEAFLEFLPTVIPGYLTPGGEVSKETIKLDHKELVVNVTHQEKELTMSTGTVRGQMLFCALTELPKDGFSETELSEALKEHGWNRGHSTLAPALGDLVRDGTLIRLGGIKPAKYRLPTKVKLNITGGV